MRDRSNRGKTWDAVVSVVLLLLSAAGGYTAVYLPWQIAFNQGTTVAGNPVDGLQPISLFLLFLVGGLAGALFPSRWWLVGPSTVLPLTLVATVEILLGVGSHNLWPLEFVVFAVLVLPGFVGALCGMWLRRSAERTSS